MKRTITNCDHCNMEILHTETTVPLDGGIELHVDCVSSYINDKKKNKKKVETDTGIYKKGNKWCATVRIHGIKKDPRFGNRTFDTYDEALSHQQYALDLFEKVFRAQGRKFERKKHSISLLKVIIKQETTVVEAKGFGKIDERM